MSSAVPATNRSQLSFGSRVRSAVIWRSGSQILGQAVQWAATFTVIRLLSPSDYGLFAMTQVVLVFLNLLNGYGLASGLVQQPEVSTRDVRQLFGMLILLNAGLALGQVALAPLAAAYYRQPMVADMLRVQAVLYLTTPFIALPVALLSRDLDFRHQAKANLAGALASAATALGGALAGWGVWTLVAAPLVMWAVRGMVLTWAAGSLVVPSFDFRGAGRMARYGGVVAAGQLFWFAQSQADVFIAGRTMSPHLLGIYTTALFLAQIFVAKVVPPLNDVAFSAYARLDTREAARGFLRAVRVIMAAGLPFYVGLAATADPLVQSVLGPKWTEVAPVARLLAVAMPFMTLQVLVTPACDARGRPGVGVLNGAMGAAILSAAFLAGVRWGPVGLAAAWVAAYPLYLAASLWRALPVIGVRAGQIVAAVAPPLVASAVMGTAVMLADRALPPATPHERLAVLVAVGVATYAGWLLAFARPLVRELLALARGRQLA